MIVIAYIGIVNLISFIIKMGWDGKSHEGVYESFDMGVIAR